MRTWHLALSNRPEPDVLARRWFTYLIAGVAAVIIGVVILMSKSPDPQLVRTHQEVHGGTVASPAHRIAPAAVAPPAGPGASAPAVPAPTAPAAAPPTPQNAAPATQ